MKMKTFFAFVTLIIAIVQCSNDFEKRDQLVATARDVEKTLELSNISESLNTTSFTTSETTNITISHQVDNNATETDKNETRSNETCKVVCLLNSTDFAPVVEIVNSSQLLKIMHVESNITSTQTPATCVVVLFYSPSCPFSCMAAPHFNALPRVFPDIKIVAVDTSTRYNFNAQYGIVGVPSLLLFHNGRPVARFNNTSDYSLVAFSTFITKNTGLKPEGKLFVTSVDFSGPISSVPLKHTDYCLVLSWIFIILCSLHFFYYSSLCQWMVDSAKSAWREAEAQHHHQE